MPCEQYQKALIDLACAATEPRRDLRAHLDACPSCRASLERERLLLASIDSGAHNMANAKLPPSLLPVMRARLAQGASAAKPAGTAGWTYAAAATAALFVAALLVNSLGPRHQQVAAPEIAVPQSTNETRVIKEPSAQSPAAVPPASVVHIPKPQVEPLLARRRSASAEPEVIVPPDEREALARFLSDSQTRWHGAESLVAQVTESKQSPFPLPLMQIARLEIPPLEPLVQEREDLTSPRTVQEDR
jgi:hypothetical protein